MSIRYIRVSSDREHWLELESADTFMSRFRGLMGRKFLEENRGLFLAPCSSIHMCFMRFPIDAVYVDSDFKIMKVTENLRPWIGVSACIGAWGVMELAAGTAGRLGYEKGMKLYVQR